MVEEALASQPFRRARASVMPAKLAVRDLRKRYGPVVAMDGVSFDVHGGEIFGLIGPNGAGKTTTVECIIGLREPDSGTIEVCGMDRRRQPREVKARIGAALQTTALQDKITPREAVGLFSAFYGASTDPERLLDRFGLGGKADQTFDTLSLGQRQRLALALAFVNDPEIVVLDEPTAGLDPVSRRDLRAEIGRMREDGRSVLVTTHDIEEADTLCDRIAIIDRGRIVAAGTPGELTGRSTAMPTVTVRVLPRLEAGWLDGLPGVEDLVYDGDAARFRTRSLGDALSGLVAHAADRRAEIAELHVRRATLEDVLIELTAPPPRH
jgi:ABC-2 type transport system ATP-binding protein